MKILIILIFIIACLASFGQSSNNDVKATSTGVNMATNRPK